MELSRDYNKFPLKVGEKIPKEDLYYLYIEQNYTYKEVAEILNCGVDKVCNACCREGFKKDKKIIAQSNKRIMMEKYGVENISQLDYIKKKKEQTSLKKYGTKYAMQNEKHKEKVKQTNIEKYGTPCTLHAEGIKEKVKQTNIEKYGVENASSNKDIQEKRKQTMIDKYGVQSYTQSPKFKEKCIQTWLNNYGVAHNSQRPEHIDIVKNTNKGRYGSEWFTQSDIYKEHISEYEEKKKKTCMQRYKLPTYIGSEEYRQKNLEKYGVEWTGQREDVKRKSIETSLEKYGVKYPTQNEKIWRKQEQTNMERYHALYYTSTQELKDKNVEKYGVEHYTQSEDFINKNIEKYGAKYYTQSIEYQNRLPEILQKNYETKKKNNSFNSSKPEKEILELLRTKFDVIYQYRSEVYPFACDFYLPSLNLYIEYQGSWTHGDEPYTGTEQQLQKLKIWKQKAEELNFKGKKKNFYLNAIHTWMELDVRKRQIAKENKLNWIEFFNMDQFLNWFSSFC